MSLLIATISFIIFAVSMKATERELKSWTQLTIVSVSVVLSGWAFGVSFLIFIAQATHFISNL